MKYIFSLSFVKTFALVLLALAVIVLPRVPAQVMATSNEAAASDQSVGEPPMETSMVLVDTEAEANLTMSQQVIKASVELDKVDNPDDSYVEDAPVGDDENRKSAGWMVNGVLVELTPEELAEFNRQLYSTQSYDEYMALMATLVYYNGGVDMSKFSWWETEQKGVEVPNVVGMIVEQANSTMRNAGFYVCIKYKYNPESDMPYGYCYAQEYPAGEFINRGENLTIYIQSQEGMDEVSMPPYDELVVRVPDLIGMSEAQAIQTLKNISITNIKVQRVYAGENIADGVCVGQNYSQGQSYYGGDPFYIDISDSSLRKEYVPYLIGKSEEECIRLLESRGFSYNIVYEYDGSDVEAGKCIWQEYPSQSNLMIKTCITIKIQIMPEPTPEPTPESTPEPTPEPTPESTPEPTPESTPDTE